MEAWRRTVRVEAGLYALETAARLAMVIEQ
jgi:hypothetical protein